MLKYAIIGFGGLGKTHFQASAEVVAKTNAKLVALCDIREEAFTTATATNLGEDTSSKNYDGYNIYYSADELLEKEELDFVVTALPTYIHAEVAIKAMDKGLHVFSEKPMAINYEEGKSMLDASKKNNVHLMIGQCCRYGLGYGKIKEFIDSKKYGKVIRADFYRISQTPCWGWENWFVDEKKSGGAPLDLHVHDVDMINWYFGTPKSVTSYATNYKTAHDSIVTRYEYDDMLITATSEWGCPKKYPFKAGLFIRFEKATIEKNPKGLAIYTEDGEAIQLDLEAINEKAAEVIDFVNCINNSKKSEINPAEDSLNSLRIALAEKQSANTGKTVVL